MSDQHYDVVIIGSGPGGYVCAIRCAQLGLKTAIVEKERDLGGTCLNIGCIPSKALLHSTELYQQFEHGENHGITADNLRMDVGRLMARKEKVVDQLRKGVGVLLEKRKVEVFKGRGSFESANRITIEDADGGRRTVETDNTVIATGSVPADLPFLKPDGKTVVTSTEAIAFESIPESMLVVGAGAIGLELGSVWSRLGTAVTFVEFLPTVAAGSDDDVSKLAERIFKKQGMTIHTSTRVTGCDVKKGKAIVTAERKGKEVTYEVEKVLLSVGRKPFTEGLGLEKAGLKTDGKGRLPVDRFHTEVKGIWAIGDVIEGPMLAHKAEEDGVAVAEAIAGKPVHMDYSRVPNVIYTHPEIATIGMTERQAREKGLEIKVGKFPLQANGRALAQDATDGMAKVICDAQSDRILGAAVIAAGASEMIAAVGAHMEYGGSSEDLGCTVHPHPTISEALKEAALSVQNRAIHAL